MVSHSLGCKFGKTASSAMLLLATGCTNIFYPYVKPTIAPIVPVSYLAYAYVSTSTNQIYTFKISSAGLWSPIPNGVVSTGMEPVALVADPSNRFLDTINLIDINLSQYRIDPLSGIPQPDIPSTVSFPGDDHPESLKVDPSGHFLYVPVNFQIRQYLINPTSGILTPNHSPAVPAVDSGGSGARSITIVPSGKFLYANTDTTLLEYRLDDASGALTQFGSIEWGAGRGFDPVVDPVGRFLYTIDEGKDLLHIFAIDPTSGLLSLANPSTVTVGSGPSSLAIDPMGRYLYVVNRNESTISQFTIQSNGSVTPMNPAKLQQGGFKMIVDPSGQLAYVDSVSSGDETGVSIYRVNATGGLEPYSSGFIPNGSIDIAVVRHQ